MITKYVTEISSGYSLVDNTTGELKEFKQIRQIKQDEFIMVFLSTIPQFYKLNGNQLKFMMSLWKLSSFNAVNTQEGNIIINDLDTKNKIRNMGFDVTDSSIDVLFHQLVKAECLLKVCKGKYMLNPKYFFKGTLTDASKMTLTFECKE